MFSHPISLGLFFSMVGTLTLILWEVRVWSRLVVAALVFVAAIGLFTSVSSGPLLAVAGAGFVFLAYSDWRLAAALGALAFAAVVSIAAYSGEPYSDVVTDLALSPNTAQFRLQLYREVMNGGMTGHWWTGYGYVGLGPGTDNTQFHWRRIDIVSLYLQLLVRTGLLGLLPFVVANVLYYVRLIQALFLAQTRAAKWMVWCVLAGMVGWNLAMMSTGPLIVILQLLFLFIAISTNMPSIVIARAPRVS
jgi:O-antigen ligase